jgi:hypothetical protein
LQRAGKLDERCGNDFVLCTGSIYLPRDTVKSCDNFRDDAVSANYYCTPMVEWDRVFLSRMQFDNVAQFTGW